MLPCHSFCRSCLASLMKLLNFLQAFVGVSIVLYSAWMLNHWDRHRIDGSLSFDLKDLHVPWFFCGSIAVGIIMCLIALTGHIAAEIISGCCLCFYAVLTTILILLEASFVGYLVFNRHWEEDLPYDSTGELKRLLKFFEDNMDIVQLVGITVIAIQGLSLLLALVLRVMVPVTRGSDCDSDEDLFAIRRPLINPQVGPTFPPTSVDNKGFQSDIWSSRMRQKYGLNQSDFSYSAVGPNASVPTNSSSDEGRRCSIL